MSIYSYATAARRLLSNMVSMACGTGNLPAPETSHRFRCIRVDSFLFCSYCTRTNEVTLRSYDKSTSISRTNGSFSVSLNDGYTPRTRMSLSTVVIRTDTRWSDTIFIDDANLTMSNRIELRPNLIMRMRNQFLTWWYMTLVITLTDSRFQPVQSL